MKKILFFVFALLVFASCDERDVTLKTVSVRVQANEWKYTQIDDSDQFNNNYFYAEIYNIAWYTPDSDIYGLHNRVGLSSVLEQSRAKHLAVVHYSGCG